MVVAVLVLANVLCAGAIAYSETAVVTPTPTPEPTPTPTPTYTPTPEPTNTPTPTPPPTATPVPTQRAVATAAIVPTGSLHAAICALPWPCAEALNVCQRESGCRWVYNAQGSGACGPFQTLPCVGWMNLEAHLAEAYRKWRACNGGSFACDWYRYW